MTTPAPTWLATARKQHVAQLAPNEVPELFLAATWSEAQPPLLRRVGQDYLQRFWDLAPLGLAPAFLGRAGTYKSFTAALIARAVRMRAMLDVCFVQCGPEFERLERRRFDDATDRRLEQLAEVPFLVLDDFTKVKPASYALDMLDGLVERRYATRRPTLYTGNVTITADDDTALVHHFGAGFTRRFREGSKGLVAVLR